MLLRRLTLLCFCASLLSCKASQIGAAKRKNASATVIPYEAQTRAVLARKQHAAFTLCTEPPPLTARDINLNVNGTVKAKEVAEATGSVTRDTTSQKLYELDAANLMLQYALFRLCELSMNGYADNPDLLEQYSKIVDRIIEITASEQSASRALAIAEAADKIADERVEALHAAEKALALEKLKNQFLLQEVEKMESAIEKNGNETKALKNTIERLRTTLSESTKNIADAETAVAESGKKAKAAQAELDSQIKAAKESDANSATPVPAPATTP